MTVSRHFKERWEERVGKPLSAELEQYLLDLIATSNRSHKREPVTKFHIMYEGSPWHVVFSNTSKTLLTVIPHIGRGQRRRKRPKKEMSYVCD